tara:strand:+ start:156 stop:704 length:549 start_codon:yes stop_codon:yes gene_type:complete
MKNLFKDFDVDKFKGKKPPANKSLGTYNEVKEISKIPMDKKFVDDKDDIAGTFNSVAKKNKISHDKKLVDSLIEQSSKPILELKRFYKRPRPKRVAEEIDIDLKQYELNSMKTPSYPSGHSAQGIMIGKLLADKHPNAAKDFIQAGKDISYSRNVAKAHYKSDSTFGEEIGDAMYNHIKDKV